MCVITRRIQYMLVKGEVAQYTDGRYHRDFEPLK